MTTHARSRNYGKLAIATLTYILLIGAASAFAQTAQTAAPSNASRTQPMSHAQTAAANRAPIPPATQLEHMQQLLTDWPDLARYRAANAALPPLAPGENRVVFMGDSITDMWGCRGKPFFPGESYINRGISGQTTPQMLVRFWPDVIALQPKAVLILAGTNDIAGNTGPSTPRMIEDNLQAMAALANANHIRVILASILPAANYPWKPGIDPVAEIRTLNDWMQSYCAASGCVYLDYYSTMATQEGGMKQSLTIDGVHPNQAGYDVMAPVAERAIREALAER